MEIAESAIQKDLGMSKEDFEGAYALWKIGADPREISKTFGCDRLAMMWYLMMRGAGEGERPTHWVKPQ